MFGDHKCAGSILTFSKSSLLPYWSLLLQVKLLCEKAKEILMGESNVQVWHAISSVGYVLPYILENTYKVASNGCFNIPLSNNIFVVLHQMAGPFQSCMSSTVYVSWVIKKLIAESITVFC